ncbi:MAG: carboxypeptidase regulatory-like domain-containing protein [Deltaproteobacteria bacterium]|nr:carboxypeptidase regulatory-like domain-containing protein [Deltaproteobacteria bacterium]
MVSRKLNLKLSFVFLFVLAFFLSALSIQAQETKGHQPGGVIKGVVNTPWVKRYPALVYLDYVKGEFPPPKKEAFMGQKSMVFAPHVLPVLKGTTVDFTNDDTVAHNVFTPPGAGTRFNLGLYGVGVKKTVTFDNLGENPLLCNVHPEMLGYVIVLQNPYYALTDNSGKYEIKNVTPGTYKLKVWHEKLRETSKEVTVEAGKTVSVDFERDKLKQK